MTKKEMIKEIQVAEAKAWKTLGEMKDLFGAESDQAASYRSAWSALFDLRERMGIPSLSLTELIANDLLPVPRTGREHDIAGAEEA
jgi:hypothetical protein